MEWMKERPQQGDGYSGWPTVLAWQAHGFLLGAEKGKPHTETSLLSVFKVQERTLEQDLPCTGSEITENGVMPEIMIIQTIICTNNNKTKIDWIPCYRADSGLGASPAASVMSTTALWCSCFYYLEFKAKKLSSARIRNLLKITPTPTADSGFKPSLSGSQGHLSLQHVLTFLLLTRPHFDTSKDSCYKYMYSSCNHQRPIVQQNLSSPGCCCCKYQLLTHSNL